MDPTANLEIFAFLRRLGNRKSVSKTHRGITMTVQPILQPGLQAGTQTSTAGEGFSTAVALKGCLCQEVVSGKCCWGDAHLPRWRHSSGQVLGQRERQLSLLKNTVFLSSISSS